MKILIVDPITDIRGTIKVLLNHFLPGPNEIIEACRYQDALDMLRHNSHDLDLVLTSLSLEPDHDDKEGIKIINFCHHLFSGTTLGIPTILMSPTFEHSQSADTNGTDALLTMPPDSLDDFRAAIRKALFSKKEHTTR